MTKEDAIHFANCLKNNYTIDLNDMQAFCDEAIKALEQEPRKGHWIFDGDCLICSKCKEAYSFSGSNYCPNCGADMREVEE